MYAQKVPVRFLILFLAVVLIAGAVLIAYRSPLAPLITRVQPTVARTTTPAGRATATPAASRPAPTPTAVPPTARPTETQATLCGLNDPKTILFTGTGSSQRLTTAEAIRVMRVDPIRQEVIFLAFPRDLYVRTNVLESANMQESRLGSLYSYKNQITAGTERQQTIAATTVLAQVLYDNFGVTPDHFITVNLADWVQMVDAVGGVEVTLAEAVDLANGETLPAGTQRLDGRLAGEFIRFTDGDEPARLARQDLLARAMHGRIIQGDARLNPGELLQRFNEALVTDLSAQQLTALACLASKTPEDKVTFLAVDETMTTKAADGALIPDLDAVRTLVEQTLNP